MAEEHTQQPSTRGKSRRERIEHARSRDILDVASELRMELFRSGRDYRWKEHDSLVISPDTNLWHWFSRHEGGDVIALVQTMKEVNFNQAIDYLNDGTFKAFTSVERAQEAFSYYLKPYEQPFDDARTYLKEQRGLSDETIDFFLEKGVLAQANAKVGDEIEPVLVFKNLDVNGQVVGAALQGLVANPDKYFGRGYLKQIMKNSQPYNGMHVNIGTPDRLIFAESSIDLMSYYELHKDSLSDVRLVSLEGLKIGTMGRHLVQLQSEMERRPLSSRWTDDKLAQGLDEAVKQEYFKDGKNSHLLTLAVDHDAKGKELIQELTDMGVPVIDATPPKAEGQAKMDWNAYLQETKATFSTERYQEEIDNLISDITLGDDAYYLWHDHEYRRLEGQPELAAIDNKVLSQLENQKVNQEIATEANEQNAKTQGGLPDEENNDRKSFHSPNQEIKTSLDQKVAAIVTKEAASNQVNENEQKRESSMTPDEPFDYTSASAYDISEHAFQKIREYTQSPEDLLEYMDFMSKFPQLSPRNVALIHDQWRGANAVATYNQWQVMGEALGIKTEDVIPTKASYTNKRTGETKEVIHQGLSVKTGEKSKITLFRPLMVRMIPVLDDNGKQLKNDKGNPKYKKLSEATPQEKAWVKEGNLPVRQFQERDLKTGQPKFTTYKVFELSQTTLKPESYPKAMPNRHYNFNMDKVKTREVLEGLCDYAESIGVKMMKDEAHVLDNAKGAFYSEEQLILINPDNTPGEKIATTIHELAHATLHNPKLGDQYKELTKGQKEFEAEMTSYLLSKHFGLDTSEKAIDYMAKWTDNLKALDDKQLTNSFKRVHKTVSKMLKQVETHTKPYQMGKKREKLPNFPKSPSKGPSR